MDVGGRRIGVAVTDPLRVLARPLTTIRRRSRAADVSAVADLISEWQARLLVVGLPLLPSGDRGDQARAVEAFVAQLKAAISIPVELWDESFTTLEAAARLRDAGHKPDRDREAERARLDAVAAAVILEEWLRAHQSGAADSAGVGEGTTRCTDGAPRPDDAPPRPDDAGNAAGTAPGSPTRSARVDES